MLSPEYAPFTPADLARLTSETQEEFFGRRIEIDGKTYSLSRIIFSETPAPNLSEREKTAGIIAQSLSAATRRSSSLQERPFVSLSVDSMDPTIVGIATRVELDGFDGRLSPPDERFLRDSLNATINLSNDERNKVKRVEEGTQLIANAIGKRSNLLCLFTLGGFFACRVSRMEERGISSQGGLLVPMPNQKIVQALHHPTEPESLYFLLRVKQLGEERIRTLTPLTWTAIKNCQSLLPLRRSNMNRPFCSISRPGPITQVYETGEGDPKTPLAIDIRVPTYPKPGASGEKPRQKPQRRIW